jgi:alginate O-acetyltransferase complex protein AlgI
MLLTFSLTVFAWIFFRSENIRHAFNYIDTIFSNSLFTVLEIKLDIKLIIILLLLVFFFIIECFGRESKYAIEHFMNKWKWYYCYMFYYILLITIIFFSVKDEKFIYFQF